jgi:UTP--glucose-1-phosphate uridylyltransferase
LISKAVIPAAGLGTRLLPATKEIPKEMLPVYAPGTDGGVYLKPVLQLIFEQLYDLGVREFCIVIGRGKRAVEDHFTPDYSFANYIRGRNRGFGSEDLEAFYRRLDDSVIWWVSQPEPKGFGEAVLRASRAIGESNFVVHAGDAYIISKDNAYFTRLLNTFNGQHASAVLLVHELADVRQKGVAEVEPLDDERYGVLSVAEKPTRPKSRFALEPVYIFQPEIFNALSETDRGSGGEIQLTDGIQRIIDRKRHVYAIRLLEDEIRFDVGDPESYWEALSLSHKLAKDLLSKRFLNRMSS